MRYYCTYFDRFYLLRGLTLYRSLKAQGEPFTLWALCFDEESHQALCSLNQPDLLPISLAEFERGDGPLLAAKQDRSRVEYYFTCTPSLPLYLLNRHAEIDLITYLDADLFFYAGPEPIFAEMGDRSILIIPHRYPRSHLELQKHGIYNVGLLSFRSDAHGRACLEWWRERCLEWCYDRLEEGRFADQKYLDDWPTRFEGVAVLQHPGANLAPWNWMNSEIRFHDSKVTVDEQALLFFHFHGLKIFSRWLYDPVAEGRVYGEMPLALRWRLYSPYVRALKQTAQWARRDAPTVSVPYSDLRTQDYPWRKMIRKIVELRFLPASNLA